MDRPRQEPMAVCPFCGCAHFASLCPFCRWTAEPPAVTALAPAAPPDAAGDPAPGVMGATADHLIEEVEHFKDRIETYLVCLRALRPDLDEGDPCEGPR